MLYLHADHLGSTSLTTDESGNVAARQLYHPYGTVRYSEGTLPTDFTYTGQRDVPGTGLIFMHARYYHPALGRFVSADTIVPVPANPQDWNRYSYVANNPVRSTDPSGHVIFNRPSWMYLVPGLNVYAYARDCATSISQAVDAYETGERRVGVLALHATGAADLLVGQAEATNQLNEDVAVVFSNAPLEERLPHAVHLGVWATGKAAEIVGAVQLAKAGVSALRAQKAAIGPHAEMKGPVGDSLDSHHIVQDAWAQRQNIPGYSTNAAPTLQLKPSPNHRAANAVQRAFRHQHGWNTTFQQETQLAQDAMQAAGISHADINRAIRVAEKYFAELGIH